MKEVTVLPGQALIDITIQELGDAQRLFEVARMNGISITASLVPGTILQVPAYAQDKKEIVKVFTDPANKPASDTRNTMLPQYDGIDYWGIEIDFVVS